MRTGRFGSTSGRKCHEKETQRKLNTRDTYRDTGNVEPEMQDYTVNNYYRYYNWSHRNNNRSFKAKFGNNVRKTFSRFATKDKYAWNITHHKESTAV